MGIMKGIAKNFRIAARHARLCLARDMQYRAHFLGRTLAWFMWTGMYLAFIEIILGKVGP